MQSRSLSLSWRQTHTHTHTHTPPSDNQAPIITEHIKSVTSWCQFALRRPSCAERSSAALTTLREGWCGSAKTRKAVSSPLQTSRGRTMPQAPRATHSKCANGYRSIFATRPTPKHKWNNHIGVFLLLWREGQHFFFARFVSEQIRFNSQCVECDKFRKMQQQNKVIVRLPRQGCGVVCFGLQGWGGESSHTRTTRTATEHHRVMLGEQR